MIVVGQVVGILLVAGLIYLFSFIIQLQFNMVFNKSHNSSKLVSHMAILYMTLKDIWPLTIKIFIWALVFISGILLFDWLTGIL